MGCTRDMNEQPPDPDPRAPRGGGPGAGGRAGGQASGAQSARKSRKAQRQRRRSARVIMAGVLLVEELTRAQRARDRDRLTEYARMLAAALTDASPAEMALRSLRAELAAMLHVSEYAVEREFDLAYALDTRYPATGEVLGAGLIGVAHVQVICDAGVIIGSGDDALARHARYEAAVLTYAVVETPGRLRPIAKRLAEQFAEVSLEERHEAARSQRRVEILEREDGMAELYAFLPAEVAYAIRDRIQRIAKQAWRAETAEAVRPEASVDPPASDVSAPPRSLDEVRADTLSELLLSGNPYTDLDLAGGAQPRSDVPTYFAHLQVVVPVAALTPAEGAGVAKPEPESGLPVAVSPRPECELDGYGPISARVARDMLDTSHNIYRVDADRVGNVLRVDRYKPTKQMRDLLRARDRHCRFPGCTRLPMSCEIDHTIDWQYGGATATGNLAHLCKSHHALKHHTEWKPVQDATGTLTWKSPAGRSYADRPPGRGSRIGLTVPATAGTPEWRTGTNVRFAEAPDPRDPNNQLL